MAPGVVRRDMAREELIDSHEELVKHLLVPSLQTYGKATGETRAHPQRPGELLFKYRDVEMFDANLLVSADDCTDEYWQELKELLEVES